MPRQRHLCVCYLLVITFRVVNAAQYNTSADSSWIQLEAEDTFSGRNGESTAKQHILNIQLRSTWYDKSTCDIVPNTHPTLCARNGRTHVAAVSTAVSTPRVCSQNNRVNRCPYTWKSNVFAAVLQYSIPGIKYEVHKATTRRYSSTGPFININSKMIITSTDSDGARIIRVRAKSGASCRWSVLRMVHSRIIVPYV